VSAHAAAPHLFVIFGGTGDLTRRKLMPALTALASRGELPESTAVLSAATREMTDEQYRADMREPLANAGMDAGTLSAWCAQRLYYQAIARLGSLAGLRQRIEEIERAHHLPGNRILYLALPPDAFAGTITELGTCGLNRSPGWTRIVIEKPFGRDLESASALNRLVHEHFAEEQVYRIDHYLGKETVQNLLVFRFANPVFESIWNRDRVESVRVLVAEPGGVGRRAPYYEQAGALRDMVQNHLTQLLTLVAMEVPTAFDADAIRSEKVKVLRAVERIDAGEVVLGQYTAGSVNGRPAAGYLEEERVAPGSEVETFAALRLSIANWRWQGVPFHLRTGKRLPRRLTRIVVRFRRAPVSLFRALDGCELHANELTITLQPDEGFELAFEVKEPGDGVTVRTERLAFRYADTFGPLRDAYETLLLDVMQGDQTLFVHADEVEAAWRMYDPLLREKPAVQPYAAGTWGPRAADAVAPMAGITAST
jgi:glucose-6-phosphate 1-dehydrogenase